MPDLAMVLYLAPLVIILVLYQRRHRKQERSSRARLDSAVEAGLTEPSSLHPVIDPNRCIGSGACVRACPEKALGIVEGKGVLVAPALCIGHGACQAACPVDAIQLVFGTEKRGMDIPEIKPNFETNVPGIFIAGELGGMGLIRKAVEQGKQAMDSIRRQTASADELDVVIVGAGPAGISASLAAKEHGLRFVTIEQEDAHGGTVYHYPRHKIAMTAPVHLPIIGKAKMYQISKEALLDFWSRVIRDTGLEIRYHERVERITRVGQGFLVNTSTQTYRTRNVLLAIGRRGTPRKLGVRGEEQSKVVYRLTDPEQYSGRQVLVVGGGDSAAEAALSLGDLPTTTVTLSYRGRAFGRIRPANRDRLKEAEAGGRVKVMLRSTIKKIGKDTVTLQKAGRTLELDNDAVIVCAGGELPTPFLREIGVMVQTHHGTAMSQLDPASQAPDIVGKGHGVAYGGIEQ